MRKSCMLYFMSNHKSTSSFCPSCAHDVTIEHWALHSSHLSHLSDPSLLRSGNHSTVCTCQEKNIRAKRDFLYSAAISAANFLSHWDQYTKNGGIVTSRTCLKEKEEEVLCPWEEHTITDSGITSSFSNLASHEEARLLKKREWLKEEGVFCMKLSCNS